jgi:hypothetical protein
MATADPYGMTTKRTNNGNGGGNRTDNREVNVKFL